jgi:hypothetical protein
VAHDGTSAVGYDVATVGPLAALTAAAVSDVAGAARSGDVALARRVLGSSRTRRDALAGAELAVRRRLTQQPSRPRAVRRAAGELQLVGELGRVGGLVDSLARTVVVGRTPQHVLDALAPDLEVLRTAGCRRLQLPHPTVPGMEGDYLRAGIVLRQSLDRLEASARPSAGAGASASAASTCSCLVRAVLTASSLAARVA